MYAKNQISKQCMRDASSTYSCSCCFTAIYLQTVPKIRPGIRLATVGFKHTRAQNTKGRHTTYVEFHICTIIRYTAHTWSPALSHSHCVFAVLYFSTLTFILLLRCCNYAVCCDSDEVVGRLRTFCLTLHHRRRRIISTTTTKTLESVDKI